MDLGSVIFFDIMVIALYAMIPERYRPSTWWGWIAFILLTLFCTPIVSLPFSIIACMLFDGRF